MGGSKHGVGILAQILAVAVWCSVASPPSLDHALDARGRSSCIRSSTEVWGWQEERRDSPSSGLGWTGRIDDGGEGMMASHQRDVGSCGLVACLRGIQCRRGREEEEEEARVTSDAHSCSPPPHPHHPPRSSLMLRGGSDTAEGGPKLYSPRMKQKEVIEYFLGRIQAPLPLPEGDDGQGDGDAQGGGEATRPDEPWKAVRYDSHWRDVLAMCIPPSELTMHGVLTHGHIDDDRDHPPITCLPAAYFVSRSPRALREAALDVESGRFGSFYLHVSGPSRTEDWDPVTCQEGVSQDAASNRLACADDVFCDFIALEDDLFELGMHDAYPLTHHEGVPKELRDDAIAKCADGLLHFLITCDLSPIIRAQKGTPAEEVGQLLEERISHLKDSVKPKDASNETLRRPLLIIADRTADLPVMLHHACTYQALLNDVLGIHVNAVSLTDTVEDTPDSPDDSQAKAETEKDDASIGEGGQIGASGNATEAKPSFKNVTTTVPLVRDHDDFWRNNSGEVIPMVVSRLQEYLQEQAGGGGFGGAGVTGLEGEDELKMLYDQTLKMMNKRVAETHTKLVVKVTDEAGSRGLDAFFDAERVMLNAPGSVDLDAVEDLLQGRRPIEHDDEDEDAQHDDDQPQLIKCSREDKLRLFLILYMQCKVDDELLDHMIEHYLKPSGCDLSVFQHLAYLGRQITSFRPAGASRGLLRGMLSAGADRLKKMAGDGYGSALAVTARALLSTGHEEEGGSDGGGEYSLSDPYGEGLDYDHVVLFVVGGGSYAEYEGIKAAMKGCEQQVIYGCTNVISPRRFLKQLQPRVWDAQSIPPHVKQPESDGFGTQPRGDGIEAHPKSDGRERQPESDGFGTQPQNDGIEGHGSEGDLL